MFQFISFLIKSKFLISSRARPSLMMNSNAPALSKSIFRSWLKHLKPNISPITRFKAGQIFGPTLALLRAEEVSTGGNFFFRHLHKLHKFQVLVMKNMCEIFIAWINARFSSYRIFSIILAQLFFVFLACQTPASNVGTDTAQETFCVDPLKWFC